MTQPSWEDIEAERRGAAIAPDAPFDHITRVMERIGLTADGKKLREWLHDSVILRKIPRGLPESALRDLVAEQRFAGRLYDLLLETDVAPTRKSKPTRPGRDSRTRSDGFARS